METKMKTNFQMVQELDGFTPKQRGILTLEEVRRIQDTLHIGEMDELALRNLRDFTVMFYGLKIDRAEDENNHQEMMKLMDVVSGITGVIDSRLWNIGAEV